MYQAYATGVYNIALHYTQQRLEAEEITQDVFLKIHEKGKDLADWSNPFDLDSPEATTAYIKRMVVNQSLDYLRKKTRKKRGGGAVIRSIDGVERSGAMTNFDHPGVQLEQKEAVASIFAALNQLSPKQRTAVILLKLEGQSQAEAARILETTEGAIESLFQRAKKNLRKLISSSAGKASE